MLNQEFEILLEQLGLLEKKEVFDLYIKTLQEWGSTYRLVGSIEKSSILRHIQDSMMLWQLMDGDRILDVGSGAGFPGVVLSIIHPEKHFVLLDSNKKKCSFLRHVCMKCNLFNVEVVNERVEKYKPKNMFDVVVCLAFGSLSDFWHLGSPLVKDSGRLLAIKGPNHKPEIEQLSGMIAQDLTGSKITQFSNRASSIISLRKV